MPQDSSAQRTAAEDAAARNPGVVDTSQVGAADPAAFWGDSDLPVVGLGGSAGSLTALQTFFQSTPETTGMAFVVILHLSPEHESTLAALIQQATPMPVVQVVSKTAVRPDHVYVIPPGKHLTMQDGSLDLTELDRPKGKRVAVDHFFRTLADTHGAAASAIILSGVDGDGALGLKRIKERGGLTIAQDPDEAQEEGMPRAAIATGIVDWVLPVEEMPKRLVEYRENAKQLQLPSADAPPLDEEADAVLKRSEKERNEVALQEVLAFLKMRTGHDFSYYKRATILRRVGRRMQVNACADTPAYLDYIRTHVGEAEALLQDLLISVTNFFRDRDAFATLEAELPRLFEGKGPGDQVRVWVAACATGEEAYSIAMLLCEHASTLSAPPQIQVFATDIDESAIEAARLGAYPESIATDVSEERLRRFFTYEAETRTYRVRRSVREIVLFALHDVLKDSPFSRQNLISCRNLLIYLDREAQGRVFDVFHFALRPEGFLFLGYSESAEDAANLFVPLDKRNRFYSRRAVQRTGLAVPLGSPPLTLTLQSPHQAEPGPLFPSMKSLPPKPESAGDPGGRVLQASPRGASSAELHFKLLDQVAPPSVIVDQAHNIVHLSGNAGKFFQFSGGEPTADLLRVVHPMLRIDLRTALFRAAKTGASVECSGVPFQVEGKTRHVDIAIYPSKESTHQLFLVTFRLRGAEQSPPTETTLSPESFAVVQHLEEELDQVRLQWRDTVEQYETSTEELKASNEELQAMNEELRSATEELETGREELQSINEELSTVNGELKSKVEELSRANSDLQNLMASTNIATVFLDRDLRIQRYTPSTVQLFNIIPGDIGRPLSDLTHRLDYPGISADAREVIDAKLPVEREVRTLSGGWHLARLLPYRTAEDEIAGVVLTCVDITERKRGEETRQWLSAVVESSNDAIVSFAFDGTILSWNRGAERIFGYSAADLVHKPFSILIPPDREEESRTGLERLRNGEEINSFETDGIKKDGARIHISLSASIIRDEGGEVVGATAIAQDITVRKQALEALRQARRELEERVEQRTQELRERAAQLERMASELTRGEQRERLRMSRLLHDHVQQLLVSAKMRLEGIEQSSEALSAEQIRAVINLLGETLESSRSLAVELSPPVLTEGLAIALEWLGGSWMKDKHDLDVKMNLDRSLDARSEELRALVFVAVREILFNVVKHSDVHEAFVDLYADGPDTLKVKIRDHGRGFDLSILEMGRPGVSGLGLFSLRERLQMLGGSLELESKEGAGVQAVVSVPRSPDPGSNK